SGELHQPFVKTRIRPFGEDGAQSFAWQAERRQPARHWLEAVTQLGEHRRAVVALDVGAGEGRGNLHVPGEWTTRRVPPPRRPWPPIRGQGDPASTRLQCRKTRRRKAGRTFPGC